MGVFPKVSGQENGIAETPNLYRVRVSFTAQGALIHEITQRFG